VDATDAFYRARVERFELLISQMSATAVGRERALKLGNERHKCQAQLDKIREEHQAYVFAEGLQDALHSSSSAGSPFT
jgi:hypothetical protein